MERVPTDKAIDKAIGKAQQAYEWWDYNTETYFRYLQGIKDYYNHIRENEEARLEAKLDKLFWIR